MDKNSKSIQILTDTILQAVKEYTKTLSFDRTVKGRIISSLGNNLYSVQIKENVYTIYAINNISYNANENVWVTIIQNNEKNKIIIGKVS